MYYVALGDSMSIDLYPQLELQGIGTPAGAAGVAGAVGRTPDVAGAVGRTPVAVGAASLFHRNDDALWPEFAGRDLVTRTPGIEPRNLCVDGATIGHTLDSQLPRVSAGEGSAAVVVTVTAGGNDLLGGLFDGLAGLERTAIRAVQRYGELVARLMTAFPDATLILTTVYDPTDGSGLLPGVSDMLGPLPMELLGMFNDAVRSAADGHERAVIADAHGHFMGHGLSAPVGERWYWEPSPIEPGARGASEIRRLWLDALEQVT